MNQKVLPFRSAGGQETGAQAEPHGPVETAAQGAQRELFVHQCRALAEYAFWEVDFLPRDDDPHGLPIARFRVPREATSGRENRTSVLWLWGVRLSKQTRLILAPYRPDDTPPDEPPMAEALLEDEEDASYPMLDAIPPDIATRRCAQWVSRSLQPRYDAMEDAFHERKKAGVLLRSFVPKLRELGYSLSMPNEYALEASSRDADVRFRLSHTGALQLLVRSDSQIDPAQLPDRLEQLLATIQMVNEKLD